MKWILALTLALSGCRGDAQQCERACRNRATLVFWQGADAEIAAAPSGQRDALRKRKQVELARELDRGIGMCVSQCQSADNQDQIDCLIAARTPEQAIACTQ